MKTKLLHSPIDIKTAACIVREGGLVALPTETVYGLGANALNPVAVKRIFAAKGRPQDNPLIVHIGKMSDITRLTTDFTPLGKALAQAFWPGPLTIVLKKSQLIPEEVSAGLDTVGIRMPSHPVALALIEAAGVPIAAPSANTSGKPSPTCALHVLDDMNGRIDAVLDGGSCTIGVESTVVDATGEQAVILRPGAITAEMMVAILGENGVADDSMLKKGQAPKAPGMKYRHYAPKAPVTLVTGSPQDSFAYIADHVESGQGVLCFTEYVGEFATPIDFGLSYDKNEQARRLFSAFRKFDTLGVSHIWVQAPREYGAGVAIVNRLKKAADGQVISASTHEIIGIVGTSGSGKTYLSAQMATDGHLVDADGVYKQMLDNHQPMLHELSEAFPQAFDNGKIQRKVLSRLVFDHKPSLLRLNAITHKYIIEEILRIGTANPGKLYIDAPTLFESGLDCYCTQIIGIIAQNETCIERIIARDGIGREQAVKRIENQKKNAFFLEFCDKIIYNE